VCTAQLTSYSHDIGQFGGMGAQVLALSPQSVADHEAFAQANGGFAFPLLADVDKVVATAYGTLGPLGFYRRSIFVIDATGVVRYAHRATAGLTFRSTDEIVGVLAEL
jgi:thioredoxin-dependent peroxiredoxin